MDLAVIAIAVAFVAAGGYEWHVHRRARREREELRHLLGAPRWWGRR